MLDPRVKLLDQAGLQNGRFSRGMEGFPGGDGGVDAKVATGDAVRFPRARGVSLWGRRLGSNGVPDSDDGALAPNGRRILPTNINRTVYRNMKQCLLI